MTNDDGTPTYDELSEIVKTWHPSMTPAERRYHRLVREMALSPLYVGWSDYRIRKRAAELAKDSPHYHNLRDE